MKRGFRGFFPPMAGVTPHAGVWIETTHRRHTEECMLVTPHAGVWIETWTLEDLRAAAFVTPHAGVWIETILLGLDASAELCHSPCGSVD